MLRAMLMTVGVMLAGCASAPEAAQVSPSIVIEAGGYADAFTRAKEALLETGFALARVDARAGIISTEPRASVGYLTPWIGHHSDANESWLGFSNREQRVATIRFSPTGGSRVDDMRALDGPLAVEVSVLIERVEQPGRRVDATGVDFTHRSSGSMYGVGISVIPTPSGSRPDPGLIRVIREKIY